MALRRVTSLVLAVAAVLLLSVALPSGRAQINPLSETERANVGEALENLEQLTADVRAKLEAHAFPNTADNQQAIDMFDRVLANLRNDIARGKGQVTVVSPLL